MSFLLKKEKLLIENDTADLSPFFGIASKILVIWKPTSSTLHKQCLIELFIVGIQILIEMLTIGHLALFAV